MRPTSTLLAIILAVLLFPASGITQSVSQAWAAKFITSPILQNTPAGVVTDASGNVYVAGTTAAFTASANFVTIKYNSAGVQQWVASYNSAFNNDDEATAIAIDGSGNVVVTGTSRGTSGGSTFTVMSTVKYNTAGAQLWATTTQIGAIDNEPKALTIDAAGNVYITGSEVNTAFAYDFLTVKLSSAGVQQWTATYNGTAGSLDMANAIAVDAAGNVYVTGQSIGQIRRVIGRGGQFILINTGYDYLTIKYNSAGTMLWSNRFNGSANTADVPDALALDASGNVYVTGQSGSAAFTISYTTDGVQQWTDLNTSLTNNTRIATDASGNVLVTGFYYPTVGLTVDYVVRKFTSAGALVWVNSYFGNAAPPNGPNVALALDGQGNSYIAASLGTTGSTSTSSYNYATIKFASNGSLIWAATYNGPFNTSDIPAAITISRQSSSPFITFPSVYVTGIGDNGGSGGNYTTVKYIQQQQATIASTITGSLGQTANSLTSVTARLSNYPNPFKGATTISYTLPHDGHVSLNVYDQSGKFIANLVEENESAGVHNLSFNAGQLAAGIYQYRIVSESPQGSFTGTKQMMVRK